MGWATFAMERLQKGQTVTIRPHGHSMTGKVNSGDQVKLEPCVGVELHPGDVVLVRVKGNIFLHLIKATDGDRLLIGNNRGKLNGWTHRSKVYGIAVEVDGKPVSRRRRDRNAR